MVVNYSMNARFTFRVAASRRSALTYVIFTFVGLLLYNFNLVWIRAVLEADTWLMLNVAKVAAMSLLFAWNYVGYSRLIFRPQPHAPDPEATQPRKSEPRKTEVAP